MVTKWLTIFLALATAFPYRMLLGPFIAACSYIWWPSRKAAKPTGVFVPFLLLLLLLIHLLLPWESMAAPRTTGSEVVKFGTLFGTSTLINFTKSPSPTI